MRVAAALAVVVALGCRKPAISTDAGPSPTPSGLEALPLPEHREAGRWTQDGVEWRAIVVAPNVARADLRRLARALRAREPRVFFDIYDDDTELPRLVAANGNDDALPAKWRDEHAVATIAGAVTKIDGGVTVSAVKLYEWRFDASTPLP